MLRVEKLLIMQGSHPSRGAWIEIKIMKVVANGQKVAPLAGCVD